MTGFTIAIPIMRAMPKRMRNASPLWATFPCAAALRSAGEQKPRLSTLTTGLLVLQRAARWPSANNPNAPRWVKPADPAAHAKLKELHPDLSSGAAEIYAASVTLTEVMHLSYICEEMGFKMDPPFTIHVENMTAIAFSEGSVRKSKLKHIDVRQHWVEWLRSRELCKLRHVDTKSNLADFYTKILDTDTFRRLRDRQMVSRPLPAAASA